MADWSDEEIQRLRDLSDKGLSPGKMVEYFPGRKRNSIIGKMFRENIARSFSRVNKIGKPVQVKERRSRIDRLKPLKEAQTEAALPKVSLTQQQRNEAIFAMFDSAPTGRKLLMEATSKECKWPMGGEMLNPTVCAEPTYLRSYCKTHYIISCKGGLRYA